MEALARHWRELSTCCVAMMSETSFSNGVVQTGAGRAPVSCLLGEGRPEPSSPLDVERNSSVESSIMAHWRVDAR
jgi:hypothetical protein